MPDEPVPPTGADAYAQLLALAVHEFRTPASVVSGYVRMLLRDDDPSLSERQRKMVEEAEKSCARIVGLIGELSELSKLDSGAVSGGTDRFDVFALVAELAAGVHQSGDREVTIEVRGENAGAFVRGDLGRLRNAFTAFLKAILR